MRPSRRAPARRRICALVLLMGALVCAHADKITADAWVNRNPIGLGEKVYAYVDVSCSDASKVEVIKTRWPDGLTQLSGPTIRTYVDNTGDEPERRVRVGYVLRGDRIGRLVVGEIDVEAGGVPVQTDRFILGVGYWWGGEVRVPMQCSWRVDADSIVTGQNVRAVLVLRDMLEIPAVGNVSEPLVSGAFVEQIDRVGPLDRTRVNGETVYQLPIAAFLITPSRPGSIYLPEVRVSVGEAVVKSAGRRVAVEPLPAEVSQSGAVGRFDPVTTVSTDRLAVGEELSLSIRVEGTGNLNILQLPEPSFEGLVFLRSEAVDRYAATYEGYEGYREARYRFLAQNPGSARIVVPAFSWLDPVTGRIRTVDRSETIVTIVKAQSEEEVADAFPFRPEGAEQILSHRPIGAYRKPGSYLWLLPGMVVLVLLSLLKKARIILVGLVVVLVSAGMTESDGRIDLAIEAYDAGEYEAAANAFERLQRERPGNPGILYNRALCASRLGSSRSALHLGRAAVWSAPSREAYRRFVEWQNDRMDLPEVVYPRLKVNPDRLFYLFMASVLVATGFFAAQLVRKRGLFVIFIVLALISATASAVGLAVVHLHNREPTGIISPRAVATRAIPSAAASLRYSFAVGTSVRVIDRTTDYLLVGTRAGRTGWVPVESVYFD